MSPVGIFFMYLGAALGVGAAAVATTEIVAPEVAEDVKKHIFRRVLRRDRPTGDNASGR